jgi:hypothetical protein
MEIILNNPKFPWNFQLLCSHPNITWQLINEYNYLFNDYYEISGNPNITWDIVKNNNDKQWNFIKLTVHKNITLTIILNNPNYPWDYFNLINNPNITLNDIVQNPNILPKYEELPYHNSFNYLGKNTNIRFRDVINNPELKWNYKYLSQNSFDFERDTFIRNKYRKFFMKEIAEELIMVVMHPRNFDKFAFEDFDDL